MKKRHFSFISFWFLALLLVHPLKAQDTEALSRIKTEGFQHSQVMKIITDLSDSYGPRLTGSRKYYQAAQWASQTMEGWGLKNVHFEQYCNDCMGWEVKSFNLEMISPDYQHILAYPYAWTESSQGMEEAEVVWIRDHSDMDQIRKEWSGKLKGKMVLLGEKPHPNMLFKPLSSRFSEEQLDKASASIDPYAGDLSFSAGAVTLPQMMQLFKRILHGSDDFFSFLKQEGAAGMISTSNMYPGNIHPSGTYANRKGDDKPIPYFSIAPEHFGKITRLIDKGITPKVRFHLETEMYLEPKNNVDIIAEIPGSDPKLKDEVVMIGAHFDSWHSGEGATDNGAGSAVMMEVMRILQQSGVHPRRTIRIGLWYGEEQGYLGSLAYAEHHFGKMGETKRSGASKKISAYLNMDNGAGKMRGIYLQGNEGVRSVFAAMLKPYAYLDVDHLTIDNTNFTDHDVFDYYNIPAFQIIQDGLNYETVTHHADMDVLEYVPEEDMKINATVLAGLVYQIANREEMLPRK